MNRTILIVDDEADIRDLLRLEFEMEGMRVLQAANGREALRTVEREPVDLILSDLRMPGGSGLLMLDALRTRPLGAPKVVLMSGFTDLTQDEAHALGAVTLLSKPFQLDQMVRFVLEQLTVL